MRFENVGPWAKANWKRLSLYAILGQTLIFVVTGLSAQTTVLWQIGKLNQTSSEFAATPSDHVIYNADSDDWSKIWPGEQKVGSSYEVRFQLKTSPRGTFVIEISALTYNPGFPALAVQVNGQKGIYYLHPQLSYNLGDRRSIFDPGYASNFLAIELPASYLKSGENSIVFSCMGQEGDTPQQGNISSLRYDAITLKNDTARAMDPSKISATVTPTIFYQQKKDHLVEIVEAVMRVGQSTLAGSATLQMDGHSYTVATTAIEGFGEERIEFQVPEWTGTLPGHLEVQAGSSSSFDMPLTAARKWTVFVVPHTHVDVGYTDFQGKVAEAQSRTFDEASDLIGQYPDFRFATDGSWNLEQYLATRSPEKQNSLLNLIRDGKIGVPAQYANLLTGYASMETLYRSLYYSKSLSHQYKIPFEYANTTDVPTYTGAYPSILASAGIKYWAVGGNNDRAPFLSHEAWNEKSPFWWEGPDGKKVLFWYARCYEQVMFLFGLPPRLQAVRESLPVFLQAYSGPDYKPDVALVYGTQAENTDLYPETAHFATDWDKNYAYPKLQYSTFIEFFQYLDKHYGNQLATYKGDMGPYWEDGIGSDAMYAAEDRGNQSAALAAEIMSTVSQQVNPNVRAPKASMDAAWKNIVLFSEHTWASGNSVSQPDSDEAVQQLAVKDNHAVQARFQIADVAQRAASQLANEIHVRARTLVVFNTLSWQRDALVETDLNEDEELVDLTTHQTISMDVLSHKDKLVHVRFLANNLPSVGYKCFRIQTVKGDAPSAHTSVSMNPVIENQYYRVKIDIKSGTIQSIFDKELQRELIDTHSPYKFGQYLYVSGGDGKTRMINPFNALPLGNLTIHPAINGRYLGATKTSWGSSIKLRSSDVNTQAIDLELILSNYKKEIEFRYTVQKKYVTTKEAVYFAFPVAASSPDFAYGIQQGWVNPAHDLFKGASLEWFTIQKWMAAKDTGFTVGIVPVDAPLASLGDINRGEWPGEFHPKSSTIFSYAMNNYWHTNYAAGQGGTFTFRYVMTSADHLDPAALTRLGSESMEPAEVNHVVGQDKVGNPDRPMPAEGTSFMQIDASNVILVTWKGAEDGHGTILRLQETAGKPTEASIQLPHTTLHKVSLDNAVEDKLKDLDTMGDTIKLTFHPNEVLTVRLEQ